MRTGIVPRSALFPALLHMLSLINVPAIPCLTPFHHEVITGVSASRTADGARRDETAAPDG